MSRKSDIFEQVLSNPYNNDAFVGFVRELLNNVEMVAPTSFQKRVNSNFFYYVEGYYHIGNYTGNEGNKIAIFSVALKKGDSVERARTMQRNFIKPLLEQSMCDGALVAFYTPEEPEKWRVSFIRLDYEFSKGKITEKLTPAKRYSYLVGAKEPCNTAKQRLFPIFQDDLNNPDLDDLEEAFSVEKVTKEFFDLYCEKYHQLREYLEGNEEFMQEAEYRHFTSEQFAKKLLGQLVFLYFIQKKGWLGVGVWPKSLTEKEYNNVFYTRGVGNVIKENLSQIYRRQGEQYLFCGISALEKLPANVESTIANNMKNQKKWGSGDKQFVRTLFDWSVKCGKNFFDDYLEPLFYDTLNRYRDEMAYSSFLHCRIPFLNGGLFEELDNYNWKDNNFNIPNSLFSNEKEKGKRNADGILDIFDRYNFTMNEDEPMEREVAIDPEMLGKVFENLLDIKDRKSKGAFYTPREIVHYMCQETLINYLVTKTQISEPAIRDFILYGEYMRDEDTIKTKWVKDAYGKPSLEIDKEKNLLISEEILSYHHNINRLQELDNLLANVKVADLAVGSGAFPLGMLNEIVKARQVLSEYLSLEMNRRDKLVYMNYSRKPYDLKVNTIKNCIFACDIEPSAVDIAKLRLWLSIVIDDEISESDQMDGIVKKHSKPKQLPNLDCNIICGNSLIDEFEGQGLITESSVLNNMSNNHQLNMYQQSIDIMIQRLVELQEKLFFTKEHSEKEEIKVEIQSIYDEIILAQLPHDSETLKLYNKAMQEDSKSFVLWQLYFPKVFKDNGGFDIVIGNPPYLKEIDYKDIFAPVLSTKFGQKYGEGKMNFWYFFFHKGMNLLNSEGHISFIAPNYFVAGSGASKLNERFVNETSIKSYIDFNKTKVFDTADVQCMIFVVGKNCTNRKPFLAYFLKKKVDRNEIGEVIMGLNKSEMVSVIGIDNQENIYSLDGKINFANAKYAGILDKIEYFIPKRRLFKATQGIVENPSTLNKKNIATVGNTGVDISKYEIGEEVFVVSKDKIEKLDLDDNEKVFLREYHEPNDVYRYKCSDDFSKYLLYLSRETCPDIEKYPNIKAHLIKYKPFMELRRETKKGTVKWFQLHWPRKENLFKGEKVVYPQMGEKPTFAYSNQPFFTNMSANIVYACEAVADLKVMTCVLNSSLAHFWLLHRAKNRGIGLDIAVTVIDGFPINETIFNDAELKDLANKIIENANQNLKIEELDRIIDKKIYELYNISYEEICAIEEYIKERTEK